MPKGAIAVERATTGVAAIGITFPAWEMQLHHFGSLAGTLVPILSASWLAVQIAAFVWRQIVAAWHG